MVMIIKKNSRDPQLQGKEEDVVDHHIEDISDPPSYDLWPHDSL